MSIKKRGLNKGLDALLAETLGIGGVSVQEPETKKASAKKSKAGISKSPKADTRKSQKERDIQVEKPAVEAEELGKSGLTEIKHDLLSPGRYQPRKTIQENELEPLAESIKVQGILQPIVARPLPEGRYEIIAGERRWRAAKIAELDYVPVLVKEVPDEAAMAIGLIENIQREDLNPLEEAIALERLASEFGLTHAQVAKAVGKSRTSITNLLRLLSLQPDVKTLLERGDLEVGHAKVLLGLQGSVQSQVARAVVAKRLSVRETENLVSRTLSKIIEPMKSAPPVDPDIRRLQTSLSDKVGAEVKIDHTPRGRGKIVIQYNSLDELEGILAHIE